jgi:hypothetical protein
MKLLFTLLLIGLTTFLSFSQSQIDLGLRTKLFLDSTARIETANNRDIILLNNLNSKYGVSSYMNKIIRTRDTELIVSFFTSGTFDEYKNQLVKKHAYTNLYESISREGVKFISTCISTMGQSFARIIFAEKDLNITIIIDQNLVKADSCNESFLLRFIEKIRF